jgi:hypothetical protein
MPTLLARSAGPDIAVDHAVVMVGRHPQCDARLGSVLVSRRHCISAAEGGEVVVRGLGSTNGTWINGRRVEAGRLKPGDEMSIADVHYRLEEAPAYQAPMPGILGGTEGGKPLTAPA